VALFSEGWRHISLAGQVYKNLDKPFIDNNLLICREGPEQITGSDIVFVSSHTILKQSLVVVLDKRVSPRFKVYYLGNYN